MNDTEQLKILNDFIQDIDCMHELDPYIQEVNIFNVLKVGNAEIRHSNMLAWLLDPLARHGLGNSLLKKLLIYACADTNIGIMKGLSAVDVELMDLGYCRIEREKENIDILITNTKEKLVCAIENKVFSGEHSNQLDRYRERLVGKYGQEYRYVLLYLTPTFSEPSDTDNWVPLSYETVIKELEVAMPTLQQGKAKTYIQDYIDIVRRSVMEDSKLKEICYNLYKKHQSAFDLIINNLPNAVALTTSKIHQYLGTVQGEYGFVTGDKYTTNYVFFTPNAISQKYGGMGSGEWCNNNSILMVQIEYWNNYDLVVKLVMGPALPQYQHKKQEILDIAKASPKYKKANAKLTKWKTLYKKVLVTKDEMADLDIFGGDTDIVLDSLKFFLENDLPKLVADFTQTELETN